MSSLRSDTLDALDSYWASTFHCDRGELRPRLPTLIADSAPDAYRGLYVMSFGGASLLCSGPTTLIDAVRGAAQTWTAESINHPTVFAHALGSRAGRVIGPAWIGYRDVRFERHVDADARLLDLAHADDIAAISNFRARCPEEDWEVGGLTDVSLGAAGVLCDGQLAAVASYSQWGSHIAHIAVVTDPEHRGRSFGCAATSRLVDHVLERGLIPQYRTLMSNTASMGVAARLGFLPYAISVAVRLSEPSR